MTRLKMEVRVSYRPNGTSLEALRDNLEQAITDAMNNGTLTGDTPAEVESVHLKIKEY
jgi:hypothetical protein